MTEKEARQKIMKLNEELVSLRYWADKKKTFMKIDDLYREHEYDLYSFICRSSDIPSDLLLEWGKSRQAFKMDDGKIIDFSDEPIIPLTRHEIIYELNRLNNSQTSINGVNVVHRKEGDMHVIMVGNGVTITNRYKKSAISKALKLLQD